MQPSVSTRLWEIDALRGISIVMMVVYHLMWDLLYLGAIEGVALQQGFWKYFQRTTASLFIFLVGASLVVSYRKAFQNQQRQLNKKPVALWPKFMWRGLKIFGWGMVLTIGVQAAGIGRIDFGVLHLIGVSIILAYPFLKFAWTNIGLWMLFNAVGMLLQEPLVDTLWLVWIGLKPANYWFLDYFPLVPWFGVVLLGIGVANLVYNDNKRTIDLPDLNSIWGIRYLGSLGRHSLTIYLLHQPLLFGLLTLGWSIMT